MPTRNTTLQPGHVIEIIDGVGTTIESHAGHIWVTLADDIRDIILAPGEWFTIDRDGKTLVAALGDGQAIVDITPAVVDLRVAA
jgi:Protein of unknown function (DUF2917)